MSGRTGIVLSALLFLVAVAATLAVQPAESERAIEIRENFMAGKFPTCSVVRLDCTTGKCPAKTERWVIRAQSTNPTDGFALLVPANGESSDYLSITYKQPDKFALVQAIEYYGNGGSHGNCIRHQK